MSETSLYMFLVLFVALHILISWLMDFLRASRARHRRFPIHKSTAQPLVTVLIPAWNERELLAGTLAALRSSHYSNWEAIIIAGGPDDTESLARSLCADWPAFTVIAQQPHGKNAALNLGLQQARGEIIVLLDADSVVEPDWLPSLIAPLVQGYGVAAAYYLPVKRNWVSAFFEMQVISSYFIHGSSTFHGTGFAIRREVLDSLGGFPQDVLIGVDWDLNQRIKAMGIPAVFVPTACHRTVKPLNLKDYLIAETRWRRAHLQGIFRHFKTVSPDELSFYITALGFVAVPFLIPFLGVWICPLVWIWILLRRIGLAIEVASYTGKAWWLLFAWILPVLFIMDLVCVLAALLTIFRRQTIFKGPRS